MSVDFYSEAGLNVRDVAIAAFKQGAQNVSVWIGSISNLTSRDHAELAALDKAYRIFFNNQENLDYALKNQIMLECIGRWRELLKPETAAVIEKAVAATAHFPADSRRFTVLIGYDGNDERGVALKKILDEPNLTSARLSKNGERVSDEPRDDNARSEATEGALYAISKKSPYKREERRGSKVWRDNITDAKHFANLLRQNSWTGHLPDVDLIIRTGSKDDPHNSAGFLSLLTDNTQYAFVDTLWPDFNPNHLTQILTDFASRERRMGK